LGRLLIITSGLAVPVVLAQISQTLMGLVDTMMVGRLGKESLAAVGVSTLLFSAVAMSLKSVDVAVQSFTARRIGQQRDNEVGAVVATAVSIGLGLGTIFMIVGLLWPDALMRLVTQDDRVRELGAQYLIYRYLGILPLILFFQIKGMFDGIGWTRIGMMVGVGMNILNVLLNWVLIFGHWGAEPMGVGGAALASTLSTLTAALVILILALRVPVRKRFQLFCRTNFHRELIKPFWDIAWPPAVQTLGIVLGFLIFYFILGRISVLAVAAGNVVMRISAVSFMPGVGVGAAVQTLVGQSLGRHDAKGAHRVAWSGVFLSVVVMGIFGVLFVFFPAPIMKLFSDQPDLIAAGVPILRLMGLVQVVDAVGLTLSGALRGAGATRAVMIVDVCTCFILMPPLAWLFGIKLQGGLMGAWIGLLVWFTIYAVVMMILFTRTRWQELDF
jgi:MATE family, multidrug efflux pump